MILPLMLLAAAGAPEPISKTEMLSIDAPDQFDVGWRQRTDATEIIELVEPPETKENWSRLITLQLAFGGAATSNRQRFYQNWREGMVRACPGTVDKVTLGTVDGMPALQSSVACPLNPKTGKPENLAFMLVEGKANLMMVQVAFRRVPTLADETLINRIANSLKVCDARKIASCEARRATGFIASGKSNTTGR